MKKNIRIIPRLDIKSQNVVKGVFTEGLRIVGNPIEMSERYYNDGADELICMDIVASLYGRNFDFDLLRSMAQNVFIPITAGGGIRTIQDINNILRAGADKVAINTFAISHPDFIKEAIENFGSQCIVLSVEAKKINEGIWEAYTDGGREKTGIDAVNWIKKAIKLGIGEILLTSIDRDGTRSGFDYDLINEITSFSPVPVIVHGGGGSLTTFEKVIENCQPDAVSAASVFHYNDFKIRDLKRYLSVKYNVRL
jgi:imidazole glycerol-phosphate synthase subunit HisF